MAKSVAVIFKVSRAEKDNIVRAAKEDNKTISEYVRTLLVGATDFKRTEQVENDYVSESEGEKKETTDIHIRLSRNEYNNYKKCAETAGCSISEYIRRSANGNTITIIPGIKELTKQLIKIGVNLNQLTVLAHQGSIREVDLFSCKDSLDKILDQLIRLQEKGDRSGNNHIP